MNTLHLLDTLRERGATLQHDDSVLRVTPSRVLDDALRAEIRCHKSELLQLLVLETASQAQSSTQIELQPNAQPSAQPLPPSLAGMPGIEFCVERGV